MAESVSFDRAASYYDQTRGFPSGVETDVAQVFMQAAAYGAAPVQTARVLEIGVGTGRIALPLAPHVGSYTGIDLSTAMMAVLRARQTVPITLIQGDATRLPFAAGAFDLVVAVHVFHLIGDPGSALRELARVLRPGGVLLHGWNMDGDDETLRDVWNRAVGVNDPRTRHLRNDIIPQHGWTPVSEPLTFKYPVERTPQLFIDTMRARVWSACWSMSDEQLAAGERAVLAHIAARGIDITQSIVTDAGFVVQGFAPPLNA